MTHHRPPFLWLIALLVSTLLAPPRAFAGCNAGSGPPGGIGSSGSRSAARTVTSWNTPITAAPPAPDEAGPQRLSVKNWNLPVTVIPPSPPVPDPEGNGPVSVQLSDPVIGNEFFDLIDLTITGLSSGQGVVLEKFRVNNNQGVIDAGATLQESHRLADGVAAAVGETFNWNRLYDVTARNGQIQAQLDFWEPSAASIPGEYVYRVSSPLGSFTAQTARLTVTNETTAQKFTGTVTAGGQPVPNAIVALLDPLTGYADFVKGTFTDASGNYVLDAPHEDEFDIVALKPGFVGPFAVGTGWILEAGETVTANLQLQAATRMITGTLCAADTGAPLPGVEMVFISLDEANRFDDRLCTIVWTDEQGRYSVPVTSDRWGAMVRVEPAAKIGFITSSLAPLMVADTRSADATDTTVRLRRAGSVIWGRVLSGGLLDGNDDPLALGGIEVMAISEETGAAAWTVTDVDGDYRLGVGSGRWRVFPFPFSLEESAHSGGVARELVLTDDHQSIEHDFVVRPAGGAVTVNGLLNWLDDPDVSTNGMSPGGEVWGYIQDSGSNAVGRLRLLAYNTAPDAGEVSVQATYESDGYYNFCLPEGQWQVIPDPAQAAKRGLLLKDLPPVTIATDSSVRQDVASVTATATIELTITDSASAPVTNLLVKASASIGGSAYTSAARSDASGVARLPALPGTWTLVVQDESTDAAGKKNPVPISVDVTGATAAASLQLEDYANAAPQLSPARIEAGAFRFSGTADSGRQYAFQTSTNLLDWHEIGRARAQNNAFNLVDGSTNRSRVFYRVVQD